MTKIAVVGAGLSGVVAARTLVDHGHSVTLFERGRKVGGRCSSRDGEQTFDHGAQYITVTDPRFESVVNSLRQSGVVQPWQGHFVEVKGDVTSAEGGPVRFVGVPNMRAIVESLAEGLDLQNSNHIHRIEMSDCGWYVINRDECELGEYNAVILAMPPEQARALLPSGYGFRTAIGSIKSKPSWALMMEFKDRVALSYDSASIDNGIIEWAARDSSKPNRPAGERWVAHSTAQWAQSHLQSAPKEVAAELYAAFLDATGLDNVRLIGSSAHRWRLGVPAGTSLRNAYWDDELCIGTCGDWCVSGSLEGAYLSAISCADLVHLAMSGESSALHTELAI